MERDTLTSQMKALKQKARAARKAGKADLAASFKGGSDRLARRLRRLGKPPAAPAAAG